MRHLCVSSISLTMLFFLIAEAPLYGIWQGLSVHGKAKYRQGFDHLDYADPSAAQGGELNLGWTGSFDTLNPFSAKGISPLLLSQLVFQKLGQSTLDEPFSVYPELAERFDIAADQLSMTIHLNPDARFSDGKPVTSEDVLFSFRLFRSDSVSALYKSYWSDIRDMKIIDRHSFQFIFTEKNTELPAIALQMTVLPRHIYQSGDFGKDFSGLAIGSGPYIVDQSEHGSFISFRKNPDFWGKKIPFYKGRFNFGSVNIRYYRDHTAMVEAFRKGDFDLYVCYSSSIWATRLVGKRFDPKRWILRENWPHKNNEGSQGFFFNLKNKIFQKAEVRQAISLALDFDWINKTLFYSQYIKNTSFFENSDFKASGLPSGEEKKILKELRERFPADVPESVLTESAEGRFSHLPFKKRLREARKILKKEGFILKDGVLTSEKDQLTLSFRFLLRDQAMARAVEPFLANLKKIGIQVSIDMEEASVYQRKLQKREFDMAVLRIPQSQSPGNEQIDFWHSSQADEKYSRNYYGLKNSAVDEMIERIIHSETREDLILNTRVLDRILSQLHIAVHNWHNTSHRIAMWNRFSKPEHFPDYYDPFSYLEFLWFDQKKADSLQKAMQNNTVINL
ncbi:MAG: ABC transporter substrate-binding protein [Deltaproteobacteria bacterium]|nr:ABC transporter substrate-binding protein [Deltaproteobacteria bacterium]